MNQSFHQCPIFLEDVDISAGPTVDRPKRHIKHPFYILHIKGREVLGYLWICEGLYEVEIAIVNLDLVAIEVGNSCRVARARSVVGWNDDLQRLRIS
jgi:hypothetical protein